MAYICLKYTNGKDIRSCSMRKSDGHCLYCPFCQSDEPFVGASDEMKATVLRKFVEIANITLKMEKRI